MVKSELISAVAKKFNIRKRIVEKVINGTVEVIEDEVAKGQEVSLIGFGKFSGKNIKAKRRYDVNEKKFVQDKSTSTPKFDAGLIFVRKVKEKVNE